MNPVVSAALASWRYEPWLFVCLATTGWVYLRGWRSLARDLPERLPTWRAISFVSGLVVFFVAVASPLDAFAGLFLQVHMLQHFLLMMVAPPLLWLGLPELPLLHGLPERLRRDGLGPFLRWPVLHRVRAFLTHPVVCWLAFVVVTWVWHVPGLYEKALLDPFWHEVEHASFFFGSLLFWFPVIQPWPSTSTWSRWTMVPYLFLASLQATAFSALFVFSGRVLYPAYERAPRLGGLSALEDQRIAGAVMWVPGSFVLLTATMILVAGLLAPRLVRPGAPRRPTAAPRRPADGDILRWPVVGAVLRSRSGGLVLRSALFVLAMVVVVDGFFGPEMSPMNLAGVLPWTYWRPFVVIGLLVAGNLFCMACPFMLPRSVGRRLVAGSRPWPSALRSKWLAVGLLVTYLWVYEVFALWDSPWWTAWVIVGYFGGALVVDGIFKGASFCKYVCPIGQFNFVGSLVSPLEVRTRSLAVCEACSTQDCIRGRQGAPGCDLDLFLPAKVGNLDCTFCMDCVRACPHDNVGVLARFPASELCTDPPRASVGRLGGRWDVAALALVIVFGAFLNAAGMVEPVVGELQRLSTSLGLSSTAPVFTALVLLALVVAPCVFAAAAHWWGARLSLPQLDGRTLACRLALALVPLGLAMWADHFLLHFVNGGATALPVGARALGDVGLGVGAPDWSLSHAMGATGDGLMSLQILILDLGLLASLYLGWRVVRPSVERFGRATGVLAPWATFASLLFVIGVWILFQPMEMRGMLMAG